MKGLLFISMVSIALFVCCIETRPAIGQTVTLGIPSPNSITFTDADPDVTPSLAANSTVRVTIRVQSNAGKSWTLTHLANGNLSPSIPISNVSWTVTPQPPFVNGIMSRSTPQVAAQGTGNRSSITGTFTYRIANLWSYNTGSYSVVTTFTLSAP